MESLTLSPVNDVSGTVNLPGSKSISNRALLLAALAKGETTLTNLLDSDDIRHMLVALEQLGVHYSLSEDKTTCVVQGLGAIGFQSQSDKPLELYLGNAGTAMRPLCAALAVSQGSFILTGEPRMKERPIGHLVDGLRQLGAEITYLENDGFPPILIQGKPLMGGEVTVDGTISSQFLTALLMIAPLLQSDSTLRVEGELVSKPYIDITLRLMKRFGIDITNNNYVSFNVSPKLLVTPGKLLVEGDASSASYFLAAGAIKGGPVTVTGVGERSIQGDAKFAEVLEKMGANIEYGEDYIRATSAPLKGVDLDLNHIPDAAMTIAVAALFAQGTTTIRNIYNWRVKETDRLNAMATELRKVGAEVVEGEDFIRVTPPDNLTHAEIETYNDHRIAMCFSLISLSDTPVTILDPKCTAKTYPAYFDDFATVCR
ncbi:3-phosphoshikimate 1-carboxyvinyltransferase [Algicola sagamiensis]|uniref:3-phosphoshikimate 1-carboxyvinyltransferase n=1 Tax=Algicola sagamiensis TaxID=163869 RepID=UPI00037EF038|nr:3-phosphoshikimate 1-carboxyvinyltransferase [Algicola sagamiensis]